MGGRRMIEILFGGLLGFAIGWSGMWTYKSYKLMQEPIELDYNMIEKSLTDFTNSPFDPENYFNQGKAEGTS